MSRLQRVREVTVAIIATVLNERDSISELLNTVVAQTRRPDEVIFVDGGSTDDTVKIIHSYADRLPLKVLVLPGANISEGRNAAIAAAQSEVIASTDAGVKLVPEWLESLVAPFESVDAGSLPGAVCGFFLPDPRTPFEVALGATILPREGEINPISFLPSSRSVAFLRAAWEEWPYPEWLDYCEDLVFDLGLKELGYRFEFRPGALAQFRPRSSLRAFFKQYYRYARGDGKADLWRKRHAVRYATYLVAGPAILALAILSSPWWLLALVAGGIVYLWTPYRRLLPDLGTMSLAKQFKALAMVPVIRVVGDMAKMCGYPVGLAWRLRRRDDPAVHWRKALNRRGEAD